ncbi:hypothetical protein G6F63_014299 [Rhizopus arrhizus]|nr:hypothetical protein G6F63_014299 [Rhizopus arrhizus]
MARFGGHAGCSHACSFHQRPPGDELPRFPWRPIGGNRRGRHYRGPPWKSTKPPLSLAPRQPRRAPRPVDQGGDHRPAQAVTLTVLPALPRKALPRRPAQTRTAPSD